MFELLLDGQIILEYGFFDGGGDLMVVGEVDGCCNLLDIGFRLQSHFSYQD